MEEEKVKFLEEFGQDYGYPNSPKTIDEIRATEFKRLQGLVYLDHGGATLYSELQMESIFRDLNSTVYGNPHSQSDSSSVTSEIVRAARQQVLDYCNASPREYKCIFTSGATGALKLVGEAFPWSTESSFMYTMENHNSVLGIREYALNKGAMAFAADIEAFENCNEPLRSNISSIRIQQHPVQRRHTMGISGETAETNPLDTSYNLFAFPSECNFSGMKFSPNMVKIIKEDSEGILKGLPYCSKGHWMVLIDAAKGCATQPPDLTECPADFVAISFYKIFGYPTGLGALLVRNEAAQLLRKTYFSGGTVAASIADTDFYKKRESIEESFEDGTQSFLNIAAIQYGFKIINTLTISAIARHTTSLATYVRHTLLAMRHENGATVCTVYGNAAKMSFLGFGPTIAFNLKRADGAWVGYREVEKLASLSGIQLRSGCFCNPGACSKHLGLSHADILSNIEAGHICWDDNDILGGKPTGAVRISFGYMSTFEDAKEFINFIVKSFVSMPSPAQKGCLSETTNLNKFSTNSIYLKSIIIYPIKSCQGFSADSWLLSDSGLLYDREWVLKSPSGEILTQKKVPEMSLISTSIDLSQRMMFVESPRCGEKLSINLEQCYGPKEEIVTQSQRYEVHGYGDDIDLWFTKAISRPCSLFRCVASQLCSFGNKSGSTGMCRDVQSKLNFVNEAQFLLISEESVSDLNMRISSKEKEKDDTGELIQLSPMRFRPNLVISGAQAYAEDNWRSLTIGKAQFKSIGGCNRCQMINLNPLSEGTLKSKEPLKTLASYRRTKGKILFGIMLRYDIGLKDDMQPQLEVGQRLYPS